MMSRKKRRKSFRTQAKPHYPLGEVRNRIEQGKYSITRRAQESAYDDFGWLLEDIVDALKKLTPKHFHKREQARFDPLVVYDVYKAKGLKGEDIYTHFYIDDFVDMLIIDSFKKL